MKKTMSIAVVSGKGGVGKSNLALNLSYAFHKKAQSVLLMDCDLGLANMDVLLGITTHNHIQDILLDQKDPRSIRVPINGADNNVRFDLLPANSGMANFTDIDAGVRNLLRDRINGLAHEYDLLVLDMGAGIAPTTLAFAAMAFMRLLIITPEPTSLTDSYALIKVLSARYGIKDYQVLVNQVETPSEGKQTYNRLASACERFLGFRPSYLGEIRADQSVPEAVRQQKPFMLANPDSPASTDTLLVGNELLRLRNLFLGLPSAGMPLKKIKENAEPSPLEMNI